MGTPPEEFRPSFRGTNVQSKLISRIVYQKMRPLVLTLPLAFIYRTVPFCWDRLQVSTVACPSFQKYTQINLVKIPLQAHKKYDIIQYGELDFS